MPRAPRLCRHKGYWCTKAGSANGVYFGKIGEVSYTEAKDRFAKYLADIQTQRHPVSTPTSSVAAICDKHLKWCRQHRSVTLFKQRRTLLNHLCRHVIDLHQGVKLPGHGNRIGTLRGPVLSRAHVDQYLEHRRVTPTDKTGELPGDKTMRHTIVAIKACGNWSADSLENGGGGLLPEAHRPLAKLPRGFVAPKDLSEVELPTDEEVAILFRWSAVEPSQIREKGCGWRRRRPDEYYTVDSRVFGDMVRAYYATGARTGELCSAIVRDYMPRTSQICLGKHKRVQTQHNPTLRNIQVDRHLAEILKRNVQGKCSDDPLFTRENGRRWMAYDVNKRLKRVITIAGEHKQIVRSHLTPYSFRDLYISELLMLGNEPFRVAKMAGTSLREIERTYGHFFSRDLAAAQTHLTEERDLRLAALDDQDDLSIEDS